MSKYKQYIGLSSGEILALSAIEGDAYLGGQFDSEDIINLINSPIIKSKFRIFVLYPDETINYELPSLDIGEGGSYSENYQDGQRRSLSFSLLNDTGKYTPGPNSLWAGTRLRLEQGIVTNDGSTIWFWKGVYVVNNISPSVSLSVPMVQISATDKFGLFENKTGTLDSTYTIPIGSSIKNVVQDILLNSKGDGDPFDSQSIIYHPVLEGKTTQVEISKTEGDTFGSLLKELATQLSAEIFYNSMGQLTLTPLNEVSNDSDKPLIYEFQSNEGDFAELNFAYNLDEIINRVIVVGKSDAGATYRAVAVNDNPESPFCYQKIGYRTGNTINDSNITTQYLAEERAQYELRKQLMLKTTTSVTVVINPLLTVNNVVSLTNKFLGLSRERFLIQGFSFSLDASGTCSISISNVHNLFTKTSLAGPTEVNFDEEWVVRELKAPTLFYNDKKQEIYWKDDTYAASVYSFYINGEEWKKKPWYTPKDWYIRYEGGMNTLKVIPFLMSHYHNSGTMIDDMTFMHIRCFITIVAHGTVQYKDSAPSNSILVTKWFAKIPRDLWIQDRDSPIFIGAKRIMKRKMARRRTGNLWDWQESVEKRSELPTPSTEGKARMVISEQMGYVYLNEAWQVCLTRHQVARRYYLKDPRDFPVEEENIPEDLIDKYFPGVVYYIQNRKEYVRLAPVMANNTILGYKWEPYILPSSKEPFQINRNFSYGYGVPRSHTYIDLKSKQVKQTGKTFTSTGEAVRRQDIIAERQINEKGYVPHNSGSTRSFDVNNFYPLRFKLTQSYKKTQSNKKTLYYNEEYSIVDITPLVLNAALYDNYKTFSMNKEMYRRSYSRNRTESGDNFWYRDTEIYLHNPAGWEEWDEDEEEKYLQFFNPSIHIRVLSSYPKTETVLENIRPELSYVATWSDTSNKEQHWVNISQNDLQGPNPTSIGGLYEWYWEDEEKSLEKSFYSKETENPKIFYKKKATMDNLVHSKRKSKPLQDIHNTHNGEAWDFSVSDYYADCALNDEIGYVKLYVAKNGIVKVSSSQSENAKNIFNITSQAIGCGVGVPFYIDLEWDSTDPPTLAERTYNIEFKLTSELDLPIRVDCLCFNDSGEFIPEIEISRSFNPSEDIKQKLAIVIPWFPSKWWTVANWCLLVFSPDIPGSVADSTIVGTRVAGAVSPWEPHGGPANPSEGGGITQSRKFKVTLCSIYQEDTVAYIVGEQDHDIRLSQIIDVK